MNLKAGIYGTGYIAGVHGRSIAKTEGIELVAVAGRTLKHAQELAAKQDGQVNVYPSFEEMLAREKLDCVYFCIPPFAHRGEVEAAAARGLHVLLEKPLALDSVQALEMVRAIEAAGVISQVGFHLRFLKTVERLKTLIAEGRVGAPALFTGRFWVNMEGSAWWRDPARSGGQIYEQITHLYDLAAHLFGDVASASGAIANLTRRGQADYGIEDTSVGMLTFANGALASVTGSNAAVPMHFYADFRAVFGGVTVDYETTGQPWVTPDRGVFHFGGDTSETVVEDGDPYLAQTRDFVAAIREGRPARTPAREGLQAIELIERIRSRAG